MRFNLDRKLVSIFLIAIITRFAFCFVTVDLKSDYYWEYGDIAKYILDGKGISFAYFDSNGYAHGYQTQMEPYPTAFIPMGYVTYLIPFLLIDDIVLRNLLILLSHFILSGITAILVIRITQTVIKSKFAYLAGLIYALLPEFIYASNTYGTTQVYHFLSVWLIYLLLKFENNKSYKLLILISVISGIVLYFRSEFIIFFVFLIAYWLYKKRFRESVVSSVIVIVIMLPWQIRNYNTFDEIIPFTTTNGYNFWKGHSQYFYGDSLSVPQKAKINSLEGNIYLERELNKLYMGWAKDYIGNDNIDLAKRTVLKAFYFFLYDTRDPRSGNIFYLLPWLVMLALSIYGFVLLKDKKIFLPIYIMIVSSALVVIVYSVLPRYQTMLKPLFIPFIAIGLEKLYLNIFNGKRLTGNNDERI